MFKFLKKQKDYLDIAPAAVAGKIADDESLIVLDVRTPAEFSRDGHISGSLLMPLSDIRDRINELPADSPIVCVCRSGARSSTACEALFKAGYTNVFNMSGGMIAWKRAGLATD